MFSLRATHAQNREVRARFPDKCAKVHLDVLAQHSKRLFVLLANINIEDWFHPNFA
jgi:hypothetical protein